MSGNPRRNAEVRRIASRTAASENGLTTLLLALRCSMSLRSAQWWVQRLAREGVIYATDERVRLRGRGRDLVVWRSK